MKRQSILALARAVLLQIVCMFSFLSNTTFGGPTTLNPQYYVETYVTYSCPDTQFEAKEITFDNYGNLYLSHWGNYPDEGFIYRIDPDKHVTKWIDNLGTPRRIAWAGGTNYGDYFYVADATPRDVLRIAPDGTVATFCHIGAGPQSIAIDRTGAYGDKMYVASRDPDQIYVVSDTGSVALFSGFPGSVRGGHVDLAFDPGPKYGGFMYAALERDEIPQQGIGGIFRVDQSGSATRFSPDEIVSAWTVEVDPSGMFGGDLFFSGRYGFSQSHHSIWCANPSGEVTEFTTADYHLYTFTFGSDGAMYLPEYSSTDKTMTVHRIALIPAPGAFLLGSIGAGCVTWLRRRKTL